MRVRVKTDAGSAILSLILEKRDKTCPTYKRQKGNQFTRGSHCLYFLNYCIKMI